MGGGQRFPFQRGSCRFVEVIQKSQDREREAIASDQENVERQSKRKARKEV